MASPIERTATGLPGIDSILGGGLSKGQMFLVDGAPGVGKTTLALQFLLEGARRKERCLYVTLSESKAELETVADSHGWKLDGIDVAQRGCTVLMLDDRSALGLDFEGAMRSGMSYLADTVLLTRFFEARGAVEKALSVIKKRSGTHEDGGTPR
jgi:KaiC/GvpD/RAD55 family RecA-like ATPase